MFDVGFWELMMIGVVALVVIGPERLPGVARTTGKWVGKIRRFVGDVKADIDQELKAEELKRILDVQRSNKPLQEIIDSSTASLNDVKKETESILSDFEKKVNSDADDKNNKS
jgi:sec-independent protein translocase protein TatB